MSGSGFGCCFCGGGGDKAEFLMLEKSRKLTSRKPRPPPTPTTVVMSMVLAYKLQCVKHCHANEQQLPRRAKEGKGERDSRGGQERSGEKGREIKGLRIVSLSS